MDSWVTDSFYSHFPSYSNQRTQREALAKTRQLEYQTYLSRLSTKNAFSDGKSTKRNTTTNRHHKRQKLPASKQAANEQVLPIEEEKTTKTTITATNHEVNANVNDDTDYHPELIKQMERDENRTKFLNELEKMNLPDIFNEDVINARNKRIAEVRKMS